MLKNLFSIVVLLAVVSVSCAQTWSASGFRKYTTLMGVYATQPNELYCSLSDNAVGNGVLKSVDYAQTAQYFGPAGKLNMDITFAADNFHSCMTGLGGIFVGTADSGNYTSVEGARVVSQNVENIGTTGFGVAGSFSLGFQEGINGVAVSMDYGQNWQYFDIHAPDPYVYASRFASFPSETTWYVATGSWSTMKDTALPGFQLTSKISVEMDEVTNAPRYHFSKKNLDVKPNLRKNGDPTGYYGGVFKTTDAGKTWDLVYDTDQQYFNEIHCADDLHCMAVGENDNAAYVVSTVDGGKTWKYALTGPAAMSLGAVRMLSTSEIWVGGGQMTPKDVTGAYYHSTDGGETWSFSQFGGMVVDFTFNGDVGYAAYMTPQYNGVAVYK